MEPNLDQFSKELYSLENQKPVVVKLPLIAVFAIVTHVQLASRHPNATSEITEIAISASRQLQEAFNPESCLHQVLEMGWNPEHDRTIAEES